MKTALYFANTEAQIVLTPENDWEKHVLKSISAGDKEITVVCGGFYETRGGYFREEGQHSESVMLRLSPKVHPSPEALPE